jgi:uncharacterized protein YdeI (BOF family)
MNKILSLSAFAIVLSYSVAASAGFQDPVKNAGGFNGPGLSAISVADALKLSDDAAVVLEGTTKVVKILRALGFDDETKANIKNWIKGFDKISVREQSGAELLGGLTDKKVNVVCDPVVLLERKYWDEFAIAPKYKKPYILVYFLENNHGSRDLIDYLHKTLGYEVVLLNEYIRDFVKPYHKKYSASPEEFVGLFKNASFIYTNSFHGTAFATIFNKPFITAIAKDQENAKNNNDSRKIDFLKNLGLEDRLYTDGLPEKDFLLNINFDQANKILNDFRSKSLYYLKNSLSHI